MAVEIEILYPEKMLVSDLPLVLECLGNGDSKRVKIKDRRVVSSYFDQKWLGYAWYGRVGDRWIDLETGKYHDTRKRIIIGYCFIKNPKTHPETMTVVREEYRNQKIATRLRDFAISRREFKGHTVYSAVKIDNPASLKSVLNSGFTVFDITKDGYIQLVKVLPYEQS